MMIELNIFSSEAKAVDCLSHRHCLLAMAVTSKTTFSKRPFPISMLLVTGQLLFAVQDLLGQENLHSGHAYRHS